MKRNYRAFWYSGANGDELHEVTYQSDSKAGTRANLEAARYAAIKRIGARTASWLNWDEYMSGDSGIKIQLED